jgi:RNA-directed DNA polymerase
MVRDFLAQRGLTLSKEKTVITPVEDGFDFLGLNIRRYGDKLLTKPSQKSVKRLLDRVRGIVKSGRAQGGNASLLIHRLNPLLRGWANYHRHGARKSTFVRIDHEVWKCLWRWAQRRHPRKRKQWIKDRYFVRVGGQDWVFCDTCVDPGRHLFRLARMPIRRHVKVWQDANPFDPAWRAYFAQRRSQNGRPA